MYFLVFVSCLADESTLVRSLEARLATLKSELQERNEQVVKLSYSSAEFTSAGHYARDSMEALSKDLHGELSMDMSMSMSMRCWRLRSQTNNRV